MERQTDPEQIVEALSNAAPDAVVTLHVDGESYTGLLAHANLPEDAVGGNYWHAELNSEDGDLTPRYWVTATPRRDTFDRPTAKRGTNERLDDNENITFDWQELGEVESVEVKTGV